MPKINNMNNNKKNIILERTKEERQSEVRTIVGKLNQLHLKTSYDEIKELFRHMKTYVDEAKRVEINIPFPDMNVLIKGVLETDINKRVWVKLECLDKGD